MSYTGNVRTMARRVLAVYDQASAADALAGLSWYERAADTAAALAAGTELTQRDAAGILAALSPRCSWELNVRHAARLVDAAAAGELIPPRVSTTGNRSKAWAIACGARPDDVLSGPKVRAFYANICGDVEAVTVDAWAARAAEGERSTSAPSGCRYDTIADAYRAAAIAAGITPRDMQATVWVCVRRRTREERMS